MLFGDLVVAAFFESEKPKEREEKRRAYADAVVSREAGRYRGWLEAWRQANPPLAPFHWEIEFPEAFERENPGFDAFVGNPPFAGKNTTASANVMGYTYWLKHAHVESHGNADLVAHFFRRGFDLVREEGAFGLIATNTIGQGDTRATGLRWICQHGSEIFALRKRYKWPGRVAVVVSVVHVMKAAFPGPKHLDDRQVERITAFLFHRGGNDDPVQLAANVGKSFVGNYVLGMGFTFDDTDSKGVATPLAVMRQLIEKDPRNQEVIFPYIGGEEVNTSPTQAHHRYVINFGERSEEECRRRWPDLMAIVEAKVKPDRIALPPKNNWNRDVAKRWWQFGADRQELRTAIAGLDRVLVTSRVRAGLFTLMPPRNVFSEQVVVFPFTDFRALAVLQSQNHDLWMRFFSGTALELVRYAPSDCFETFPFPESSQTHPGLEAMGKAYHELRAALMVKNNEGLTKTYNRFHDPDERDPEIAKLRELHAAMDRAVLDAHGWSDIKTDCEFLLDYEIDEEEWGNKKKPYRYRWPDEVRDEVLARLLDLNAQRAKEETHSGTAAGKKGDKKAAAKRAPKAAGMENLFP